MRPAPRRSWLSLLAILIPLVLPASVGAFPLTTCTLSVTSTDASGKTIATATSGGNDSTETNPLLVDWDGTVSWHGTSGDNAIKNNSWHVDVFMIPTPLRGGDANDKANKVGEGTTSVRADAPFQFTGLYYVSGEFKGDGGSCVGSGWFKLTGNPVSTIPFWIAVVIALLGLILLALGLRGAWGWAVLGGLLTGLGLAAVLAMLAVLPIGAWTPLAALGLFVVVGLAIALLVPKPAPPPAF
jgi:hypothetical protein